MATYTTVADLDLAGISALYSLTGLALEPLAGGAANSSFRATSDQGTHVLTILDNHDHASALRLAEHTEALFSLGLPTVEIVRNAAGDSVSLLDGKPILLKSWIPGRSVDELPPDLLPAAGALLARLHMLPTDRVPQLPAGTRRLSPAHEAAIVDFPDREFAAWLTARLAAVRDREAGLPPRAQVISHGDVFTDNLVVRPTGDLALLDWETVSLDSDLLDLGMTLLGLANAGGRLDAGRAALIVDGYTKTRPLTPADLAALPDHTEHAALIIAFHRYHRHNIRFPNPAKAVIHREMIAFVDSLEGAGR
ncbi:phosphotransferase [Actinocorallia herbida]|uniref:phosphotransferase n=1 Tax=Actinocorallia herbida TaxID=58109 RepID=UPI001477842C|nr:phosphotransferase [Actinocorallia herbida]